MTVRIDKNLCNGCGKRPEGFCEEVCPGDLFYRKQEKAHLREPSDCWDCFACVKDCPRGALSVELPFQISETKNRMIARIKGGNITWQLLDRQGEPLAEYRLLNRKEATLIDSDTAEEPVFKD